MPRVACGPLLLLLIAVLTACNATETAAPGEVTFVRVRDDSLTSCAQVIERAVDDASRCVAGANEVCSLHVAYDSSELPAYWRGQSTAPLAEVESLGRGTFEAVPTLWRADIVKVSSTDGRVVTLVLTGDATLDGISPTLDSLSLSTPTREICPNVPPSGLLVQAPEQTQVVLNINGASITAGTTLFITADTVLTVSTLAGSGVVSAQESTRIVPQGSAVDLPLTPDGRVDGPPADAMPYTDRVIALLAASLLPRPVELPDVPVNLQLLDIEDGTCAPEEWTERYTVRRGDNLTSIASIFGLTATELQIGNCLENPNRLSIGQVLNVPTLPPTDTPTLPAPTDIALAVDDATIRLGECTTVRWATPQDATVFFEDTPVSSSNGRQVCPTQTTNYVLRVQRANGEAVAYRVEVVVIGG